MIHPATAVCPITANGHESRTTHIAWIDDMSLTRDAMSRALRNADNSFEITPFDSINDCIRYSDKSFDAVLYHSHEDHFRRFSDVEMLSGAYPHARIVLLSDSATFDAQVFGRALKSGASTYLLSRVTSLKVFAKTLCPYPEKRKAIGS